MALPTNLQRPPLPYTPLQTGGFVNRYDDLEKAGIPPKGNMLDGDDNFFLDQLNITNDAVNGVAAGILPGSDDDINDNKFPTPSGEGNISWTLVQNQHMDDNCCDTRNYLNGSVTPEKLQAIPGSKLTSNSVPDSAIIAINGGKITPATVQDVAIVGMNGSKLTNGTVADNKIIGMSGAKLTAGTVPDAAIIGMNGSKLTNLSVPTAALAATSVTIDKINSGAAAAGTVLTALAGNGAAFSAMPFKGIKQIQSTVVNQSARVIGASTFSQFDTPLQISITTQSPNSSIIVYVSANVTGVYGANGNINYPQYIFSALYKNGAIWPNATGVPMTGGQIGGLQSVLCSGYQYVNNISAMVIDTVAAVGTTNTYSLRCYNGSGSAYWVWLNTPGANPGGTTWSGLGSISYITAIEIGS